MSSQPPSVATMAQMVVHTSIRLFQRQYSLELQATAVVFIAHSRAVETQRDPVHTHRVPSKAQVDPKQAASVDAAAWHQLLTIVDDKHFVGADIQSPGDSRGDREQQQNSACREAKHFHYELRKP